MLSIIDRVTTRYKKAKLDFRQMVSKPSEADKALGEAYQALVNFKLSMDAMEEIPKDLKPYYTQVLVAIDKVTEAKQPVYQLREMVKRARW